MHKPISDSEIVTIADNQRRLKVGSPQRLPIGDIRDPTIARQRTDGPQYLSHAAHRVTLCASALFGLCSEFEIQQHRILSGSLYQASA